MILWKDGKGRRLDLENPNPGQRPGQLHVQDQKHNIYIRMENFLVKIPKQVIMMYQHPEK